MIINKRWSLGVCWPSPHQLIDQQTEGTRKQREPGKRLVRNFYIRRFFLSTQGWGGGRGLVIKNSRVIAPPPLFLHQLCYYDGDIVCNCGDGLTMNVELMVLTMNMEARLTMVEDGDGVAEVMNVVTRRGHQPTLAPPPALSISIHRMLPSSSSRAQLWQL